MLWGRLDGLCLRTAVTGQSKRVVSPCKQCKDGKRPSICECEVWLAGDCYQLLAVYEEREGHGNESKCGAMLSIIAEETSKNKDPDSRTRPLGITMHVVQMPLSETTELLS
jgi:hypothetical protein